MCVRFYRCAIEEFYVCLYYKINIVYTCHKLMFVQVVFFPVVIIEWLSEGMLGVKTIYPIDTWRFNWINCECQNIKKPIWSQIWACTICKAISCILSVIGGRPSHSNNTLTHTHILPCKRIWIRMSLKQSQTKSHLCPELSVISTVLPYVFNVFMCVAMTLWQHQNPTVLFYCN